MSTTRTVNGNTYHVATNRHERPIIPIMWDEIDGWVPCENPGMLAEGRDRDGFVYRGNVYAIEEFEVAGHDIKALGFDGVMGTSYFDCVAVCFFDTDGHELSEKVIVGHIHW